jgi:hypothetical protein
MPHASLIKAIIKFEDRRHHHTAMKRGISSFFIDNLRPRGVVASAGNAIPPLSYRLIIASMSVGRPQYRARPVDDHSKGTDRVKNILGAYLNSMMKGLSVGVITWA